MLWFNIFATFTATVIYLCVARVISKNVHLLHNVRFTVYDVIPKFAYIIARMRSCKFLRIMTSSRSSLPVLCTSRYGPCTSCGGGCVALAAYAREREGQVRMNDES